jgi:hypothetical protein
MPARLVPHPNAAPARNKNIALLVDFHAVGHAVAFATRFFAKNPAVRNRSIHLEVRCAYAGTKTSPLRHVRHGSRQSGHVARQQGAGTGKIVPKI